MGKFEREKAECYQSVKLHNMAENQSVLFILITRTEENEVAIHCMTYPSNKVLDHGNPFLPK